jgi:UDP-glucose 4-epimerase
MKTISRKVLDMRIMILGGAGFIGSNLCKILDQDPSLQVLVLDNFSMGDMLPPNLAQVEARNLDCADAADLRGAIAEFQPDRIYHLAANSDISAAVLNPGLDFRNTLGTTLCLIEALYETPVKELVFASSSAVYGEVEGQIAENTPKRPTSAYGWMKLVSEHYLQDAQAKGLIERLLCVRFPNVTGENQTHGVVFDLARKLKNHPERLDVLGDGTQNKPYVLASDLVSAIQSLMAEDWGGFLDVNLAPPTNATVSQIVSTLIQVSGLNPAVHFGEARSGWAGDVPEYHFDTAKARKILDLPELFRPSLDAIKSSVELEWQKLKSSVD